MQLLAGAWQRWACRHVQQLTCSSKLLLLPAADCNCTVAKCGTQHCHPISLARLDTNVHLNRIFGRLHISTSHVWRANMAAGLHFAYVVDPADGLPEGRQNHNTTSLRRC